MKKIVVGLLFLLTFSSLINIKGQVTNMELIDYKRADGTQVKYYNSDENVKIPKNYFESKVQQRAVWVATVYNIDMKQTYSKSEYESEYKLILDKMEEFNLNTVYFQVRSMLDAYYPSKFNPWSEFISGSKGKDPGFDPLKFMIEETHRRGMNFHAWLNPYRVTKAFEGDKDVFLDKLPDLNFAKKNKDKVLIKAKDIILNPAEPAVIRHILDTVKELCDNYDLDGINFDDYFYLQNLSEKEDLHSYNTYKLENPLQHTSATLSHADFRRENVNKLIKEINDVVLTQNDVNKRNIKFGISPAGVWASKTTHPDGANVRGGYECYRDLYADVRKWVKNNWIDYVSPQLYLTLSNANNPYADLVDWWSKTVEGTDCMLNISNGIYFYDEVNPWQYKNEIRDQFTYNLKHENVTGTTFFSLKTLRAPKNSLTREVVADVKSMFSKKVVAPIQKSNRLKPVTLEKASIVEGNNENYIKVKEVENAYGYILYKAPKNANLVDFENHENFVTSFKSIKGNEYTSSKMELADFENYKYILRAISVDGNEKLSEVVINSFEENFAPSKVKINIGDNTVFDFRPEDIVKITFAPSVDLNGTELKYAASFALDGEKFNFKFTPKLVNGVYEFNFVAYSIETNNGIFKVVVSDGVNEITSFSEKIIISKNPITGETTTTEKPNTTPSEESNTSTSSTEKPISSCKKNKQYRVTDILMTVLMGFSLMGCTAFLIKRK